MFYPCAQHRLHQRNTNAASVPSIQSLITADRAQKTIFAYTIGDELFCGTIGCVAAAATTAIQGNDTTRFITSNYSGQAAGGNTSPYGCAGYTTATPIFSINGFDLYPVTSPPSQTPCIALSGVTSDFISVPNDCIWTEGIAVQNLISYAANRPVWVIVEAGSDTLASNAYNSFSSSSVTSGSNILTNTSHHVFGASPDTQTLFTSAWIGLTLTDNTCISGTVTAVADTTHLTLSNATPLCNNTTGTTTITGGPNGNGCLSNNLCLPNGNEYRATPAEVSGEAWNAIISGAVGITWFCQDGTIQILSVLAIQRAARLRRRVRLI